MREREEKHRRTRVGVWREMRVEMGKRVRVGVRVGRKAKRVIMQNMRRRKIRHR